MSNTFLTLFLASIAGITVFNLLEALYDEIRGRLHERNHNIFWQYLEDEEDEELLAK